MRTVNGATGRAAALAMPARDARNSTIVLERYLDDFTTPARRWASACSAMFLTAQDPELQAWMLMACRIPTKPFAR